VSSSDVVDWLLEGDVAVQFQTTRDLVRQPADSLRERIAQEGDGAALLAARQPDGHWGGGFYQTKWTSSHYTLLELKNLGLSPLHSAARDTVELILEHEKGLDGGLNQAKTVKQSDVCVNGMALNYAAYFGADEERLSSIVDLILQLKVPDGGFNCRFKRTPTQHSSVHSTLSVIEGITEYERGGYGYRLDDLREARAEAVEFLLRHRLYRSERTGEVIDPEFTRVHHPPRWHYDILRSLDALAAAGMPYDDRMGDALVLVTEQRRADGRWSAGKTYSGVTHPGLSGRPQRDRWVTLVALRVLQAYPDQVQTTS
jgi:hypothetical protein